MRPIPVVKQLLDHSTEEVPIADTRTSLSCPGAWIEIDLYLSTENTSVGTGPFPASAGVQAGAGDAFKMAWQAHGSLHFLHALGQSPLNDAKIFVGYWSALVRCIPYIVCMFVSIYPSMRVSRYACTGRYGPMSTSVSLRCSTRTVRALRPHETIDIREVCSCVRTIVDVV